MKEKIQIRDANEHNLKHLNLDIPLKVDDASAVREQA